MNQTEERGVQTDSYSERRNSERRETRSAQHLACAVPQILKHVGFGEWLGASTFLLLTPQCNHRIDQGRAPGGNPTRHSGDDRQDQRNRDKREAVDQLHAKE